MKNYALITAICLPAILVATSPFSLQGLCLLLIQQSTALQMPSVSKFSRPQNNSGEANKGAKPQDPGCFQDMDLHQCCYGRVAVCTASAALDRHGMVRGAADFCFEQPVIDE